MADGKSNSDDERRVDDRVGLCEPVHLRGLGASTRIQGFAMNLSSTGAFVAAADAEKLGDVGDKVRCELSFTPRNPVDLSCRVVWVRHVGESGGPAGIGLAFEDLTTSRSKRLDTLIGRLRHDTTSTLLDVDPFAESGTWAPPDLIEGEISSEASRATTPRALKFALILALLVIAGLIGVVVMLVLHHS